MSETEMVAETIAETGVDKITQESAETAVETTAEASAEAAAAATVAEATAETSAETAAATTAETVAQTASEAAGEAAEKTGNKRKRKWNYTLMLFVDSKEGRIRQMGIGPTAVELMALFVLTVIVILAIICFADSHRINGLENVISEQQKNIDTLTSQNDELTEENADLISLREELSDKVVILSDTINRKVEEEEAQEQERAQAHMPVGFPLSSSASLEETGGDEPMVKLDGTAGSSIIAAADGTVVSVATDSVYLHCVRIDHGNGYNTIYRNDGDVMIKEGDEVVKGAILYVIGEDNTELGYQITYDGKYIDPMDLINIDG